MIMKEMAFYELLLTRPAGLGSAQIRVFPFISRQWEPEEEVKDTCTVADLFPASLCIHVCLCEAALRVLSAGMYRAIPV